MKVTLEMIGNVIANSHANQYDLCLIAHMFKRWRRASTDFEVTIYTLKHIYNDSKKHENLYKKYFTQDGDSEAISPEKTDLYHQRLGKLFVDTYSQIEKAKRFYGFTFSLAKIVEPKPKSTRLVPRVV